MPDKEHGVHAFKCTRVPLQGGSSPLPKSVLEVIICQMVGANTSTATQHHSLAQEKRAHRKFAVAKRHPRCISGDKTKNGTKRLLD